MKERQLAMKYYSLLRVTGNTKNYFVKTNIPVRNQRQAKNLFHKMQESFHNQIQ